MFIRSSLKARSANIQFPASSHYQKSLVCVPEFSEFQVVSFKFLVREERSGSNFRISEDGCARGWPTDRVTGICGAHEQQTRYRRLCAVCAAAAEEKAPARTLAWLAGGSG